MLVHDPASGATAAIDAPEAAPVEAALKSTGWRLTDILVTHHHADHTDGIPALKEHHRCRVVAPQAEAARIPLVDETVRENDTVRVGGLEARVIETPGHTLGQINYFFPADKLLFACDIRCSRSAAGVSSMQSRDDVAVAAEAARATGRHEGRSRARVHAGEHSLCAYDRTLQSALAAQQVDKLIAAGTPTIPSTIGEEKTANPFLRADVSEVANAVGLSGSPAWKVFAEIRERKNRS